MEAASLETLGLSLGVALFAWFYQRQYNESEKGDLGVDRARIKLCFPQKRISGEEKVEIDLLQLNSIGVEHVISSKKNSQEGYAPSVTYMDENQIRQQVRICERQDKEAAQELAEWLRQELGLSRVSKGTIG